MTENLKPILNQINQIKAKLNDPQLRTQVLENLEKTRKTVEAKALDVLQQTKQSRIVNDYVMPLIESEKTESALKQLNSRFGQVAFIGKLETYRQALINAKVDAAKAATPVVAAEESAVSGAAQETSESSESAQPKSARKSKAPKTDEA